MVRKENVCAQDEDDGPGDILDDELQRQLNEMADYDSANEEDPAAASHPAGVASLHLLGFALNTSRHAQGSKVVPARRTVKLRRVFL